MEKNWLIRTAEKQILGPVVKQKIIELLEKGALGPNDELASGNGYWFSIKEKALVNKYVFGNEKQEFNPVSEARTVLAKKQFNVEKSAVKEESDKLDAHDLTVLKSIQIPKEVELPITIKVQTDKEIKFPKQEDLEYPTLEEELPNQVPHYPKGSDLDFPEMSGLELYPNPKTDNKTDPKFDQTRIEKTSPKVEKGKVDLSQNYTRTVALDNIQVEEELPDIANILKGHQKQIEVTANNEKPSPTHLVKDQIVANSPKPQVPKKPKQLQRGEVVQRDHGRGVGRKEVQVQAALKKRNDNYLIYILIVLLFIVFAVFYYFKEILNKPFLN